MSTQTVLPFTSPDAARFLLAGNAYLTAQSDKTGARFTFRVSRVKPDADKEPQRLWFVGVLTGSDNERDYSYLGTIRPRIGDHSGPVVFEHGIKSRIRPDAPSASAVRWVVNRLLSGRPTPSCSVYHEGRCGRCGRTLTVPESIISGYGPECVQHI